MAAIGDDFGAHLRMGQHELRHAGLHRRAEAFSHRRHRTHRAPEMIDVPETDEQRRTRTRLRLDKVEYNLPLKEDDFTVQALRRQQ